MPSGATKPSALVALSCMTARRILASAMSLTDCTTSTTGGPFHTDTIASTAARTFDTSVLTWPGCTSPLRYFDTRLSARSILASRSSFWSPSCNASLMRILAPSCSSLRISDMERSRDRIGFSMRLFTSLVSFSLATANSASAALASTPVVLRNLDIAARASSSALAMLSCGRPNLSYASGRSSWRISSVRWLLSISPRSRAASISAVSSCTIDVATVGFAESVSWIGAAGATYGMRSIACSSKSFRLSAAANNSPSGPTIRYGLGLVSSTCTL